MKILLFFFIASMSAMDLEELKTPHNSPANSPKHKHHHHKTDQHIVLDIKSDLSSDKIENEKTKELSIKYKILMITAGTAIATNIISATVAISMASKRCS